MPIREVVGPDGQLLRLNISIDVAHELDEAAKKAADGMSLVLDSKLAIELTESLIVRLQSGAPLTRDTVALFMDPSKRLYLVPQAQVGDLEAPLRAPDETNLIAVARHFSADVLKSLAASPNDMYLLEPRQFEELVAELLHLDGYEVELGPGRNDGGIDIRAFQRGILGRAAYAVQCKRYVPPHNVGVEEVRELNGVLFVERGLTAGSIVTTSFFTRGAQVEQRKTPDTFTLIDYEAMRTWLKRSSQSPHRGD